MCFLNGNSTENISRQIFRPIKKLCVIEYCETSILLVFSQYIRSIYFQWIALSCKERSLLLTMAKFTCICTSAFIQYFSIFFIRKTSGASRVTEELDEVEERVRTLLHLTRAIRTVEEGASSAVVLPLKLGQLKQLTEALACVCIFFLAQDSVVPHYYST